MDEQAVRFDMLSVAHWRKRLHEVLPTHISLTVIAQRLSEVDDYFVGVTGYSRLQNIVNNRGGIKATARTVDLLEQLKPGFPPNL